MTHLFREQLVPKIRKLASPGRTVREIAAERDNGIHRPFDERSQRRVTGASAAVVRFGTALVAAGLLAGLFAVGRRGRGASRRS